MRRIHLLVVVLTIVLLVAAVSGEASQTQEPGGGRELPSLSSGTAASDEEEAPALPDGPAGVEEAEADLAQSYNASIRIPVAALKPRDSDVEWRAGGEGGCAYASSGDYGTWWSAPLYLPDDSTLRYFRMYYNDQNTSVDCDAYLTVYDLYGRVVTEWGISSSGTGMTYVTTEQLDHIVDYSDYSYVIHWRPNELGTDMQVCGFRVYYQKPPSVAYLPIVSTNH